MASKYDLEECKHDTLFYDTNMKDAEVCHVVRGIRWKKRKFHWFVFNKVTGTDSNNYASNLKEAWPVIKKIIGNQKLADSDVKETSDDNVFWCVPKDKGVPSTALLGKDELQKKTPIDRKKVGDVFCQIAPVMYILIKIPVRHILWMNREAGLQNRD